MKNTFSPANDTIAVLAKRDTDTPVAKLNIEQDCILLVWLVSFVKGVCTFLDKSARIPLKVGQSVYFVQSEQPGYSYFVFLYDNGTALCSCKEGRNHRPCQHTAEAALYEACHQAERDTVQTYEFKSDHNPVYTYRIEVRNGVINDESHEDCPSFHYRRHCKHMDAVAADIYGKQAA